MNDELPLLTTLSAEQDAYRGFHLFIADVLELTPETVPAFMV